jgi:signal transduction histidine kinase
MSTSPKPLLERSILRQLVPMSILGVVGSLVLFTLTYALETRSIETKFRELATSQIISVRSNISVTLDIVNLVRGHFGASGSAVEDRETFGRMLAPIIRSRSFIQGVSWNPLVRAEDVSTYEAAARADGLEGFRMTERDAQGQPVPVASRPTYVPVFYMEPQASNRAALGFDLASNAVRKAALDAALEAGQPIVTGRITLVQEYGDQYGVLVLGPIYRGNRGGEPAERRANLIGYVSGVYRLGDLVNVSTSLDQAAGAGQVRLFLLDRSAPADTQILFPKSANAAPPDLRHEIHVEQTFDMSGRQWQLIAIPGPEFQIANRPLLSFAVLAISLIAVSFYLSHLRNRIATAQGAIATARQIEDARNRLRLVQGMTLIGSLELDWATRSCRVGDGAADLLGLARDGDVLRIEAAFACLDVQERQRVLGALRAVDDARAEFEVPGGEGARIIEARAHRIDGQSSGARMITLQDVTARRAEERERTEMIERMAESSRFESLGHLAAGIAHEINTPLQYIQSNITFVGDEVPAVVDALEAATRRHPNLAIEEARAIDIPYLKSEIPAALREVGDGIGRVSDIVEAVKSFAHPSGKQFGRNDLNDIVRRAVTISRNSWKYAAELTLDLAGDLPPVECVASEIGQAVVNLVSNAAHAIEDASRPSGTGRIAVTTRLRGDHVELSVTDNGCGIGEELRARMFNPFFTTKAPGRGTGQGLAILHTIVTRTHGGQVDVDSRVAEGTTFRITLPLKRAAAEPPLAA